MARKGSSCIKIIVGGSSSDEDSYCSNGTCASGNGSGSQESEKQETEDVEEDVAPTFILQPKEISKNIDLMKTVAMLMESKLQQSQKGPEQEKMRDLSSDIQRFPEAYQKFTSIIHQIQYLNVTANWDYSTNENSNLVDSQGIVGRIFNSASKNRNLPLDARTKIKVKLLTDVQQVFNRYHKIQVSLEERLGKFAQQIVKKTLRKNPVPYEAEFGPNILDSEEDDPQRPLLDGRNASQIYRNFLEKIETLNETLRKTKRSATDIQDSIDVLHDLISWDYKQSTSFSSRSASSASCGESSVHFNHGGYQNNRADFQSSPETMIQGPQDTNILQGRKKRVKIIVGTITGVVILLIATALLSFLRFNY